MKIIYGSNPLFHYYVKVFEQQWPDLYAVAGDCYDSGPFQCGCSTVFCMLGTFITSSNMSSNILLSNFQSTAATILEINPAIKVALQTGGGVLGDAFAPGCIIMGVPPLD